MHVGEGLHHLAHDGERGSDFDRALSRRHPRDEIGAGQPVDVFKGDEGHAIVLAEVEDLHQARVAERRLNARLVAEHGHQAGVVGELRQDALDSDALLEAMQSLATRDEDLRHAAHPEQSLDDVVPEPLGTRFSRDRTHGYQLQTTSIARLIRALRASPASAPRNEKDEVRGSVRCPFSVR